LRRALILQLAEEKFDVGLVTNPTLPSNDFLEEIDEVMEAEEASDASQIPDPAVRIGS
jgi:DNA repair photolyase